MFLDESIREYIHQLAERSPTPGGGSAAALSSALGTALLEMVCNFTSGNERYKDVQKYIREYLISLRNIRKGLSNLVDEDVKVYEGIRRAFKRKNKKNIDNALKAGYYTSLKTCRLSRLGLEMALELCEKGNVNLITDVGCGAELLNAGFNSGVFNAEINLKGIGSSRFARKEKILLGKLKKESEDLYKKTVEQTKARIV